MFVVKDKGGTVVAHAGSMKEAVAQAKARDATSDAGHTVSYQFGPLCPSGETTTPAIRTVATGANRDSDAGKLSYAKGLSSQVLQRYLEYLDQHRVMKDGSLRDWDNWKQGMPIEWYSDSLSRHVHDAIRASQGLPVPENASLEDLLCAVIFNAQGWLFELLVAKSGNREAAC